MRLKLGTKKLVTRKSEMFHNCYYRDDVTELRTHVHNAVIFREREIIIISFVVLG